MVREVKVDHRCRGINLRQTLSLGGGGQRAEEAQRNEGDKPQRDPRQNMGLGGARVDHRSRGAWVYHRSRGAWVYHRSRGAWVYHRSRGAWVAHRSRGKLRQTLGLGGLDCLLPVQERLVLFPNIFSVALSGAVSLASMVSTLPAEQKRRDRSTLASITGPEAGFLPVEAL